MTYQVINLKPFGILLQASEPTFDIRDLDIDLLRDYFHSEQLVVLRGFRSFNTADALADYSENWGDISVWPYGKVLELVEHDEPDDHIFASNYVPLHWDGMYRPQVPEYQVFHCVKASPEGKGGNTTFSHTARVLHTIPAEARQLWDKVSCIYERTTNLYCSRTSSPIITQHPYKDYEVIRYNELPAAEKGEFLNPQDTEFVGINKADIQAFNQSLVEALYHPDNFYSHQWQSGDVAIVDNYTLLHGRESFVSKSPRHLRRVHVLGNPPLDNPAVESYKEVALQCAE